MDKGEGVKPSESVVSRRSFLKKAAVATAAVLTGAITGVGDAEEVQAPSVPKPHAAMQPPKPEGQSTSGESQILEAVPVEGRSLANDHEEWGINTNDEIAQKTPIKPAVPSVNNNNATSLPSKFEEAVVGLSYDQVRALPNDDPMKEELLKQFTQQDAVKKTS